ncbi:MAG: DHH family phosphoesterase [Oscillospiraceae bacterium]|nr:DHH family phosphoesterase [Oscillospiraceae bacterium]MCL2278558.1 DHH family phosphoesterase [Oscillospiraceae bacterium]
MSKKLPRFLRPNVRLYFLLLLAFAALTFFLGEYGRVLAGAQILVIIVVAIYLRHSTRRRTEKLLNYLESISDSMDLTIRDTPLPVLLHNSESGEVVWSNLRFNSLLGLDEPFVESSITDKIPDYTWDWLLEGKNECDEPVPIGDKLFWVYGNVVRSNRDYVAMTYWVDVTEHTHIADAYLDSRLIFVLITVDNYDELHKGLSAKETSLIRSDIDEKISTWIDGKDGYLCRFDRDRYFFLFEERFLERIVSSNFSILDMVSRVTSSSGVQATLSIGIGKDGINPQENYRNASLGLEMALSRGGNQAVIRNKHGFEFFGGKPQQLERRTKVKARVMANAFGELLSDASKVFVMGHINADYDSIGAAAGVCSIARRKGKKVRIVIDRQTSIAENLVSLLQAHSEYDGVFISAQDAILEADSKTLLVVVDTSRPNKVESESLLLSCTRTAVIDHHRRAADYIENALLNFHEPYASSASELVTEMMQYLVDADNVLRTEAEALLAGIILDTKGFAINTGSATFEAAAYLKRVGADSGTVKRILQSDIDVATARYDLMRAAEIYAPGVSIAYSNDTEHNRISIAQAADELLNINGVHTSFVLGKEEDTVYVSGRSIGDVNVQVILEKMGGGGSQSTAGLQAKDRSVDEVMSELKQAIDDTLKGQGTFSWLPKKK